MTHDAKTDTPGPQARRKAPLRDRRVLLDELAQQIHAMTELAAERHAGVRP